MAAAPPPADGDAPLPPGGRRTDDAMPPRKPAAAKIPVEPGGRDVEAVLEQMRATAPDASASPVPVPPNASMIAGGQLDAGQSPAASAATTPIKKPVSLASDPASDIDAILAQLASKGSRPAVAAVKPMPAAAAANRASSAADEAPPTTGALTARSSEPRAERNTAKDESDANPLLPSDAAATADDFEAVLQSLPPSKVHTTRSVKKADAAPQPKLGLSQEDIDALIAKHGEEGSSEHGEKMISQDDIDALVKQLSAASSKIAATAAIARAAGKPHSSSAQRAAALAHTQLAPPPAGSVSTSLNDVRRAVAESLPPVMGTRELRATRWLLAAVVVLLSVCAATMATMAGSMHRLGAELRRERLTAEAAGKPEEFAIEQKAATSLLESTDDAESARGVAMLDRLKAKNPGHEDEIDLALARHFLGRSLHRQAADRYASVFERSPRLPTDPSVHLEFAECLAELGDVDTALRRVYALLAQEREFRGAKGPDGRRRTEEELRSINEAFARAHLLLGRLQGQRLARDAAIDAATAPATAARAPAEGHHP